MRKELICDNIQKSSCCYSIIGLTTRNNQTERYGKLHGLTRYESIRLTI